ncbi:MAG TPA: fused MFS/spermidine synthase [Verrucomicrobiales bacterium]|nr:fused MFS/spermidine synthase [Verrucomicrobiales bacterium]
MPNHRATLFLFSITILLSATLLFLAQLVFARMALPLLGGSPAVWNTAMVFYQAALLAGYAYAHAVGTRLPLQAQIPLQALVLLAPVLMLPFAVPEGWTPPAESNPIPWLLGLLAAGVGLPFFAVSTISPLLQKWFAATGHPRAGDPYFLYAASNAGSLLGLLAYPFLIEPNTTLDFQTRAWRTGYLALAGLALAAGVVALRGVKGAVSAKRDGQTSANSPTPSAAQRTRWVVLAMVPSSVMLSVTAYISSEIAAAPLLWVLPLALYLITFILVFAPRTIIPRRFAQRALPIALLPVIMAIAAGSTTPIGLLVGLHLTGLFVVALVCHGAMSAARPAADRLTEFYLWISFGGALGGVFNALVAPLLFHDVLEYHFGLIAAAYLGAAASTSKRAKRERWLDFLLPLGLAILVFVLIASVQGKPDADAQAPARRLMVFGLPCFLCFLMSRQRTRFSLGAGVILLSSTFIRPGEGSLLHIERSFFGVHRVQQNADGRFHLLMHGRTMHGMQNLDPAHRKTPLSYYHPTGPLGQVFDEFREELTGPVAGVGLGAGAIAAYGGPGQEMTFYEIDPVVKRLASDQRYFSYIADSAARVHVALGDARLSLQSAPEDHYQLIVLDAYSSDAIPVHLLTREALQLYLRKLRRGGLLAFHISNLHLNLRPVVATLGRDAGLVCLIQEDTDVSEEEGAAGKSPSQWAVMARAAPDLTPLMATGRWSRESGDPAARVWTDDYSSIVSVLKWSLR